MRTLLKLGIHKEKKYQYTCAKKNKSKAIQRQMNVKFRLPAIANHSESSKMDVKFN